MAAGERLYVRAGNLYFPNFPSLLMCLWQGGRTGVFYYATSRGSSELQVTSHGAKKVIPGPGDLPVVILPGIDRFCFRKVLSVDFPPPHFLFVVT